MATWPGDSVSDAVWPGVTIDWPVQRLVPNSEQGTDVDIMVQAVGPTGLVSAPSSIVRLCMPLVWTGGVYQ